MFRCFALLLAFITIASSLIAQQAGVWQVVDTTKNRYYIANPLASADAEHHVLVSTGMGISNIVLRSTDAGDSWQVVLDNGSQTSYAAVAHPSPSMIVMVGDTSEFLAMDGYNAKNRFTSVIKMSTDGGATWTNRRLDSNRRLTSIAMSSADYGVVMATSVGNIYNAAATDAPDNILITRNGWQTYATVALPASFGFVGHVLSPQPGTILVEAHDRDAQETYLHRTMDDGTTWTKSSPLPSVRTITFETPLVAWGAGGAPTGIGDTRRDVIARTSDGGMTWQTVLDARVGKLAFGLFSIDFGDPMNGIAVGDADKILRTTDGGATWAQEFAPHGIGGPSGFRGVAFTHPNHAFIVSGWGPIATWNGRLTLAAPTFTSPTGHDAQPVDSVFVAWRAIGGATRYRIQIAGESVDNGTYDPTMFERAFLDTVMTGTSLVLRNLEYWYRYHGRVMAINDTQQSIWYENEGSGIFYTMKVGTVAAPKILAPTQGAIELPTSITVMWDAVPGATSYDLEIGTDRYFIETLAFSETFIAGTTQDVTGLNLNTTYYARVRARLAVSMTAWSNSVSFRTTAIASSDPSPRVVHPRIIAYPNPASDMLFVKLEGVHNVSPLDFELVNALGESVRSVKVDANRATISLDALPAGVYLVRVEGRESVTVVVFR